MSRLGSVTLPTFGRADELPSLPTAEHAARLDAAGGRMRQAGLDVLAIYGDREHAANLAYLTGFDPRFEEALLLLDRRGGRLLLVGNECRGYLPDPALGLAVELFQEFSLMGQARDQSRPLRQILSAFGVGRGTRVGCVGWKYVDGPLLGDPARALELPAYLVDLLRELAGGAHGVVNATGLFMSVETGLRLESSAAQLAQFEFAATRTSDSLNALLTELGPGVREADLERCYEGGGLPRSCHAMVSFGEKARRGLSSPSGRRARLGDPFTAAFGVWGALSCRAGAVARGPADLPAELRDFYPMVARNYFDAVVAWYRTVRIGVTAGEVVAAVDASRDDRLWRPAVNLGHYLHLDEWVHSPFSAESRVRLRSGMTLQMDIIPVPAGPFCCANVEDGVALADEALRAELAARFPELAARIAARRAFMREGLGIDLDPSVLPFSNIPAWLPPFALTRSQALVADDADRSPPA